MDEFTTDTNGEWIEIYRDDVYVGHINTVNWRFNPEDRSLVAFNLTDHQMVSAFTAINAIRNRYGW